MERTSALASQRRTSPGALRNEVRGDLDWITMKALEKERARRYRAAAELAADVERHLSGEAVLAGRPSRMYRLQKYVRKNRAAVTSVSVIFAVLVVGLVTSLFFWGLARENEEIAKTQAEENLVLADAMRLDRYVTEAEDLWPTSAERIDAMDRWLERAEKYASRLEKHAADLTELRKNAIATEEGEEGGEPVWHFADEQGEQHHEMLTLLVDSLRRFIDPDPGTGALARVRRRLELAPTKEEYARNWQEAIDSIAKDPVYGGLEIGVVEGLYPIGRDPESKLYEFVHLRTGGVPGREDSKLVLTPESGLVLVLVPGGKFLMGAQKPSEAKPAGSPNVDPDAEPDEGPIHEVSLSAFFMGKYEVRQCEWQRLMGENPSSFRGENFPVTSVTWHEAKAFCEKLGLGFTLPAEAQWEYACRARTTTVYGGTGEPEEMGWYDGNSGRKTHEVGEKQANGFGIHDMHGNVWEWCEDVYDSEFYAKPEAAGPDPLSTSGSEARALRGGSWGLVARGCRSAARDRTIPSLRVIILGLRPARSSR